MYVLKDYAKYFDQKEENKKFFQEVKVKLDRSLFVITFLIGILVLMF